MKTLKQCFQGFGQWMMKTLMEPFECPKPIIHCFNVFNLHLTLHLFFYLTFYEQLTAFGIIFLPKKSIWIFFLVVMPFFGSEVFGFILYILIIKSYFELKQKKKYWSLAFNLKVTNVLGSFLFNIKCIILKRNNIMGKKIITDPRANVANPNSFKLWKSDCLYSH